MTDMNRKLAQFVRGVTLLLGLAVLESHNPVTWAADEAPSETLTNAQVIELQKLGLGDEVIVAKIKASKTNFDTSIDGLKQLKEAGVSDPVIKAMVTAAAPVPTPVSAGKAKLTVAELNDPKVMHPPGIWLYEEPDGKPKMTKLEPSVFAETKSGGGWGMAWGATSKTRGVINGPHAQISSKSTKPVFYFYFEVTESGLSENTSTATSPNEFTLCEMEVKEDSKRNERRLVIGKYNMYGGGRTGPDEQAVRQFDFEKLGDGMYKVTAKQDLKPGEYCYFYTGSAPIAAYGLGVVGGTSGKVFDFGIEGQPKK
jgi:hypothetical protein